MEYTLYKRGNRPNYFVSFHIDGRRVTRSTGTPRNREAHQRAADIYADVCKPKVKPPTSLTEHLNSYITGLTQTGRAKRYVSQAQSMILKIFGLGGIRSLDDLQDSTKIHHALDALATQELSAQTRSHYAKSIKAFTGWLTARDLLREDPGRRLKRPSVKDADRVRPRGILDRSELRQLLESTEQSTVPRAGMDGPRRALLYRVATQTGLRLSELSELTTESIRMAGRRYFVHVAGARTKSALNALVPIQVELAQVLLGLPAGQIFPALNKAAFIKDDLAEASVPFKDCDGRQRDFHSLRTYFVTTLIEQGLPVHEVQKLARHQTPSVTLSHYAKLRSPEQLSNAIADISFE